MRSFVRKGQALVGLGRHREAVLTYEEGLKVDPFNWDLKRGLQEASDGVVKDLLSGMGTALKALKPASMPPGGVDFIIFIL